MIRVVIELDENGPRFSHPTNPLLTAQVLEAGHALAAEMLGLDPEIEASPVNEDLEAILALGMIERAKLLLTSKLRQAKPASGLVLARNVPAPPLGPGS